MAAAVKVGAVMYDPKVSVIWEIIRDFFESQRVPIDVAFFSTYELQVDALLGGSIAIAWNSPLAWLDAQRRSGGTCRAIAMRDTDRDRVTHIVAHKDGPVGSLGNLLLHPFCSLNQLDRYLDLPFQVHSVDPVRPLLLR